MHERGPDSGTGLDALFCTDMNESKSVVLADAYVVHGTTSLVERLSVWVRMWLCMWPSLPDNDSCLLGWPSLVKPAWMESELPTETLFDLLEG